ncbi:MAG: hypothetical protein MUC74_12485 [Ideonella sp.]|nr:hypothetical protein [Ideonella sp.]
MSLAEQILAGLVLVTCAVLGVRLAIGETRRRRFDAAARAALDRSLAWWRTTVRRTGSRRDPVKEQAKAVRAAAREADAVIRRAQSQSRDAVRRDAAARPDAEVDGNVIHPRAFRRHDPAAPQARPPRDREPGQHPGNDTLH